MSLKSSQASFLTTLSLVLMSGFWMDWLVQVSRSVWGIFFLAEKRRKPLRMRRVWWLVLRSMKVLLRRRRLVWECCFLAWAGESMRSRAEKGKRCDSKEALRSMWVSSDFWFEINVKFVLSFENN